MANTYVAIATVTVGSGGVANIDFQNIPQTYTDLYVVLSGRTARAAATDSIYIKFNNNASNYSFRDIDALGTTIESGFYSDYPAARVTADTATASTFGTWSAYVPNYTGSNNKSVSLEGVSPNNSGTQYIRISAGLWSNSAAITRITLISQNAQNFLQYSTATLYGIKSS